MTARPHANFSQFWPQTTMAMRRNQLNSHLEQMRLGLRLQKAAVLSGGSGTDV
jgi:cephalosporin-C deacetylase-like acetyl esterase